jgi:hypothetical protein
MVLAPDLGRPPGEGNGAAAPRLAGSRETVIAAFASCAKRFAAPV